MVYIGYHYFSLYHIRYPLAVRSVLAAPSCQGCVGWGAQSENMSRNEDVLCTIDEEWCACERSLLLLQSLYHTR